jgi:hypothetical protein
MRVRNGKIMGRRACGYGQRWPTWGALSLRAGNFVSELPCTAHESKSSSGVVTMDVAAQWGRQMVSEISETID